MAVYTHEEFMKVIKKKKSKEKIQPKGKKGDQDKCKTM